MWNFPFATKHNEAAVAGLAILCTLLRQRVGTRAEEVGSEALCWILLPILFKTLRNLNTTQRYTKTPEPQSASTWTLWIVATCLAISCTLRAETGLVECFPILTPWLLAAERYLGCGYSLSTVSCSWTSVRFHFGTTLVALSVTFALSNGNIPSLAVSATAVAPLLLVYIALLPRTNSQWRLLPPIEDFEKAVPRLSWRVVTVLTIALGREAFVYGFTMDQTASTFFLGLLKALSWYFIAQTARSSSWCIATAIGTFSLVAISDPFTQSSEAYALSGVIASLLALAQIFYILPEKTKAGFWLWGFFLVPLVPYAADVWAIRSSQFSTQHSFSHGTLHPVEVLMDNSKASFDSMLARQSKDYASAEHEYRRRYDMEPPKGFEGWYEFAVSHQSPVIDDFDIIHHSVSPFMSLSGQEVVEVMDNAQGAEGAELWTCRVFDNGTDTQCSHPHRNLDRNIGLLFGTLSKHAGVQIPNVEFLVNHLDEPRVIRPPQLTRHQIEFNLTNLSRQSTWDVLTRHCKSSHRSNLVESNAFETYGMPFVTSPRAVKDLCRHGEYHSMHGLLISPTSFRPFEGLVPILSTGTLSTMGDILFPSPAYTEAEFLYDDVQVTAWDHKRNELYWAGSTTGGFATGDLWRSQHRQRFVSLAQNLERNYHIFLRESGGVVARVMSSFLNSRLINVAFTRVDQCTPRACRAQESYFKFAPWADAHRVLRSRLVFDTDGNGVSGRFYRLLTSKSLPLKQTLFQEWHDDRLLPWVHYVPVSLGMEELPELVSWLTGNERGQTKAKEVAEQGREWSGKALKEVDMTIYIYRLLLELARLQDPEREASKYRIRKED